jgi:hypothetical protein
MNLQEMVAQSMDEVFLQAYQKSILERVGWVGLRIEMPRRGRYQVWDGFKLVADRIKHRKEALALIKLLTAVNNSGGSDENQIMET